MIVLALIAIASALVAPAMGHAFGNVELRTSAGSVAALMAQARIHAVHEARGYAIVFSPAQDTARTLYLVRDDGHTVHHVTLAAHITLRLENARRELLDQPPPLYFFPDGSAQFAAIDLANQSDRHVQLILNPVTGRVRASEISATTQTNEAVQQ